MALKTLRGLFLKGSKKLIEAMALNDQFLPNQALPRQPGQQQRYDQPRWPLTDTGSAGRTL